MRRQIEPHAESKYRELFRTALREKGETIASFINRLRSYSCRSGRDPRQDLMEEILRFRVFENLPSPVSKILKATTSDSDGLDTIIFKADNLLVDQIEGKEENVPHEITHSGAMEVKESQQTLTSLFWGKCGKCQKRGHSRKFCPGILQ